MSCDLRRIFPTDPAFVPEPAAREKVREVLGALCPNADEVTAVVHERVQFIDAGAYFERIVCPGCNAEIDIKWWKLAMDEAWDETGFGDLVAKVPCCGASVSLNDLEYDSPQGFARFVVEARNPGRDMMGEAEVSQLEAAAACKLRQILTHL